GPSNVRLARLQASDRGTDPGACDQRGCFEGIGRRIIGAGGLGKASGRVGVVADLHVCNAREFTARVLSCERLELLRARRLSECSRLSGGTPVLENLPARPSND